MKSEHRHELKTNDLAKSLLTFGDYVKEYGGRVALGVAIVILVAVLINNRIASSRKLAQDLKDDLAYCRSQIDRLTNVSVSFGRLSVVPEQVKDVRGKLNHILDESSDKQVRAEALVARGDYAWGMATFPELNIPTSQPSLLKPDGERPELLKEARDAYNTVLSDYSDQKIPALSARFGLAAVAEQGRDFAEARKQYEAVRSAQGVPEILVNLADFKLKSLEQIQKPILVGAVPEKPEIEPLPTSLPTSLPSTRATTTAPATVPATTRAAAPTTRPAGATTRPSPK